MSSTTGESSVVKTSDSRLDGAHCPSCERFIGPVSSCPYCGATSYVRPEIRVLRISAILLIVVGLGLLYVAARHRELPVVSISDIGPTMNFGYVRVIGTIERKPYVGRAGGYVSFSLYDGTSRLRVVIQGAMADAWVAGGLPEKGTVVDVAGSLSITADRGVKLYLKDLSQLKILETKEGP